MINSGKTDGVNQRVLQLIAHYNLSKSAFAQKTGVSPPVITHISTGRNKVGLDVVQKILQAFPDLSPEWLLLGSGEMIKQEEIAARQKYVEELNEVEARLKTVSQELSVAMNRLSRLKDRI